MALEAGGYSKEENDFRTQVRRLILQRPCIVTLRAVRQTTSRDQIRFRA
jgi:hypothetical protein